jgi:hypothetical protein
MLSLRFRVRLVDVAEHDHGSAGHEGHSHDHDDEHSHDHVSGFRHILARIFGTHSHDAKDSLDQALEASQAGIRAVTLSLVILLFTAGIQAVVVAASGSVALLGDTLHNAAEHCRSGWLSDLDVERQRRGSPTDTARLKIWPG